MEDVLLFGGGIVPDEDIPFLKENGVDEIFTPGATMEDIVAYVRESVAERRQSA